MIELAGVEYRQQSHVSWNEKEDAAWAALNVGQMINNLVAEEEE